MGKTAYDVQKEFASYYGYNNEIIWDLLTKDQGSQLKEKIRQLIPDQTTGKSKIEELRLAIFANVWAQNENDSSDCCMIYIDEAGRVYQNWDSYIKNNILPKGLMITPRRGVYNFCFDEVILDVYKTPASSSTRAALEAADKTTAFTGVVSISITATALFTSVIAAPIVAAAGVVGVACAGYSTFRSGMNLIDRSQHDQSIALSDRDARNSWIGVGAGLVGAGASSATSALQKAAQAGNNISKASLIAVNTLNATSIVLSGTGIANGVLDIILKCKDDEEITSMDIVQIAASLILFTHSVNNFKLANSLVQEAQATKISSFRKTLSNRQRKIFDKMSKETIRVKGAKQGKVDIIRASNEMPKQTFNDLYKINRQLNEKNIRPSFGGSKGQVLLNNEVPVNAQTLRNSVQHNVGPDVLAGVRQPIPSTLAETSSPNAPRLNLTANSQNEFSRYTNFEVPLSNGNILRLIDFGFVVFKYIKVQEDFKSKALQIAQDCTEEIVRFIFRVMKTFITNVEYITTHLKPYVSTEAVLSKIVSYILSEYRSWAVRHLRAVEEKILERLRDYFESLKANAPYSENSASQQVIPSPCFNFPDKMNNKNFIEQLTPEELMEGTITMPSGNLICLSDFGLKMFKQVSDNEEFLSIVRQISEVHAENSLILIMHLAQEIIETSLPTIQRFTMMPISTEDVMQQLKLIIDKYENNNCENLRANTENIKEALERYFLERSPNDFRRGSTKCEKCSGYYTISVL